jgi:hypothetical protein
MLTVLWTPSRRSNGDAAKSLGVSTEITAPCTARLRLVVEMLGLGLVGNILDPISWIACISRSAFPAYAIGEGG